MNFRSLAILAPIVVFCSCKRTATYSEDISQCTKIQSPQNIEELRIAKYSEVFDGVKVIRLESTDSSLIGRIDKILLHDGKIFVLDQVERKAVFEFDINGKFIRRFGRIGQGPGEYNEPNDMSVNENELAIWVNDLRKFIIYDLNGNFLREVRTASLGKSGVMLTKNTFALYMDIGPDATSRDKFNLKIFDKEGNNTYIAFEKKDNDFSKGTFFFSQQENLFLLSPGYSNNIYEINTSSNSLLKKYDIDFGKYKMPENLSKNYPTPIMFQQALRKSAYAYLSSYWETPGYLVYTFVYKGLVYDTYYSKNTKEIKYGNAWFNNVQSIVTGVNKGVYGDNIIAVYDPANIASYQQNFKVPPTGIQLDTLVSGANKFFGTGGSEREFTAGDFDYSLEEIKLIQSIKPSDNPVILIQKLKSF